MAALKLAGDRGSIQSMSAQEIMWGLNSTGVALSVKALEKAFARAGGRVARERRGNVTKYTLMLQGADQVEELVRSGNLTVLFVEGGKPRTDRRRVEELLSELQGDIRIFDPYYGARSLDILEVIPKTFRVRFLTARTQEDPAKIRRLILDFKKEHPRTEIRVLQGPGGLHDRYVLTDDRLLIVGHGLKDVGTKESFVIIIDRFWSSDLLATVNGAFETRWKNGTPI